MSLYYGYDSEREDIIIPRSHDFRTVFTYPALSSNWVIPLDLKIGHPNPIPYVGKHITEHTSFTLVDYTFDKDGTITNLVVEFQLVTYYKDGTTFGNSLGNFDISANMLPLPTRNICVVDKTFKFSDYNLDHKKIAAFYVKVKRTSGSDSGNESAIVMEIGY